ncbi:DUF3108 domain-containing protein [Tenacibaculum discolor]|uniref:DUF3108 domain-containing protein n=1 Tax=Tenacibaculum discolor TaxID=361581 RepID=UPI000F5B4478|nr:hypothetical protein [Tenacibaculum discolor]
MIRVFKYALLLALSTSIKTFAQENFLTPSNTKIDKQFVKNESYEMTWFMLKDTIKIEIGKVFTDIKKKKKEILITTTVNMNRSTSKWVDSTIVKAKNLAPIYHSSFNQQRDMVLNFGKKVTGYYSNKKTGEKTIISETTKQPYFDSNFYPQLIRWLPLNDYYSAVISIFDYNPHAKTGVISATIKNVQKTSINLNGEKKQVWKIQTTDEISNNSVVSTYYLDYKTRKLLKQDIDANGRKMVMLLNE